MTNQKIYLTPNSRLSQQLKQQWALEQGAQPSVVTLPMVTSLSQWWQQLYQTLLFLPTEQPLFEALPKRILSDFEAVLLWEKALEAECQRQEVVLMNTAATAKQLYEAWQLWAEWCLTELPENQTPLEAVKAFEIGYATPEWQLFQRTLFAYLETLQQQNLWDGTIQKLEILAALKKWQKMPESPVLPGIPMENWVLVGFDERTPFLNKLLDWFEAQGGQLQQQNPSVEPQQIAIYAATDPLNEIQQAAVWSVQQLIEALSDAQATLPKITLVAPQVSEYASGFISALEAVILQLPDETRQQLKQQWDLDHPATFYNISLGEPMTALPLIQNALDTLQLFLLPWQSVDYTLWSRWLTSPFTGLGSAERGARHQLDVALREKQWPHFKWPKLLKAAEKQFATFTPELKTALQQQLKARAPQAPISAKTFVERVHDTLAQSGWGQGRSLDTVAFQQKQKFEAVLQQFARLYDVGSDGQAGRSVQAWLRLLHRQLSETLFQVETLGQPPIQLMGMLEAGGQTFDALWVLGMQDEVWPRPANPNPFLPMAIQRQHHLPRSTAQKEHEYALQVTERLLNSAPCSVWSYAKQIGSAEYLISPLLARGAFTEASVYSPQDYQTLLIRQQQQAVPLDYVVDDQAPEMAMGSLVSGGTGILDAHRKCPLMALLDYRLGARYGLRAVEEGIQANFQGEIVHEVLEKFWAKYRTQGALFSLTVEALQEAVVALLDKALAPYQDYFATHYLQIERARLLQLIMEWLQLEKTRPSFEVLQTEQGKEVEIAGLRFRIKVDRVDQVMGETLLLDYKTGRPSIKDLLGETLQAPQLATYLFPDMDEDPSEVLEKVAGLGFGQLHAEGVKFEAVVKEEGLLPEKPSVKVFSKEIEKLAQKEEKARQAGEHFAAQYPLGCNRWADYLEALKQGVEALAAEIRQGQAPMQYEKVADLHYASAQLALRVPEAERQK
ncbi:PD-(D/E)XK nuclease family protein [Galenea microaerophila]